MKHASRLIFRVGLFASLVALLLSFLAAVPSIADDSPDYALANGWFYSQTGGGNGGGYSVLDADTDTAGQTIRFWTAFQRLGGVATLGYPASQVYMGADGFTYQAFQGGVLQWRPDLDDAVLANTFDMLQDAGKSDWLTDVKGLPKPISDDGSAGDFQKAVSTRLGWLTDSDIRDRVLANPNPQVIDTWNDALALQLYGLPKSRPEQHGPFISQLFQRISVQKWTTSVPGMPAVGSVSVVLGGDLMKEADLIPAMAAQPLSADGGRIVSTTPAPPSVGADPRSAPVTAPASNDIPLNECVSKSFVDKMTENINRTAARQPWVPFVASDFECPADPSQRVRAYGLPGTSSGTPSTVAPGQVIQSHIAGEFTGWTGETVFVLDNGQIWQQASYAYYYHYAYRPSVLIYPSNGGWAMQVDGVPVSITVRRLK